MNPSMSVPSAMMCLIGELCLLCAAIASHCGDKIGAMLLARNLSAPGGFANKIIALGPMFEY